jgi:FMN phosphatase YigB (HAD superfamily)
LYKFIFLSIYLIKLIKFDFDQTLYATKLEEKIENKIYIAVMKIGDRSRCTALHQRLESNPRILLRESESQREKLSDLYWNQETADRLATAEYNLEEIRQILVEREKRKSKRAKELRVLVDPRDPCQGSTLLLCF